MQPKVSNTHYFNYLEKSILYHFIDLLISLGVEKEAAECVESTEHLTDKNSKSKLNNSNDNSEKSDVVEVPLISTPAGQVPGILILRQNKKRKFPFYSKRLHNIFYTKNITYKMTGALY